MKKEKDIFDRIMELPVLRIFNPFYKKNKEILLTEILFHLTLINITYNTRLYNKSHSQIY